MLNNIDGSIPRQTKQIIYIIVLFIYAISWQANRLS